MMNFVLRVEVSLGQFTCSNCICYARNILYNAALRIAEGDSSSYGRLEICYGGEWGTICDDYFESDEANVACNQLGFMGASTYYTGAAYGRGCGSIFLDDLDCDGSESRLEHCFHRSICGNNCDHSQDVSVVCNTGGEWRAIFMTFTAILLIPFFDRLRPLQVYDRFTMNSGQLDNN